MDFQGAMLDGSSFGRVNAQQILNLHQASITQGGATVEEVRQLRASIFRELDVPMFPVKQRSQGAGAEKCLSQKGSLWDGNKITASSRGYCWPPYPLDRGGHGLRLFSPPSTCSLRRWRKKNRIMLLCGNTKFSSKPQDKPPFTAAGIE